MHVDPQKLQALNTALNRRRAAAGISSDEKLAAVYGVSPKTISFIRNGRSLSRVAQLLIDVLAPDDTNKLAATKAAD